MLSLYTFILLIFGLATVLDAKSSSGNSVLVILDPARRPDYSIFFDGLQGKGYDLTFRAPKDEMPVLIQDDIPSFANVIFFASDTKHFAKDITPQTLVQLLSSKTNLLIALSPKQNLLTSLAPEFSLVLPPPGSSLVSYFPERKENISVVPVEVPSASNIISASTAPVWFSGVPFTLGNNPLVFPILKAPEESFAADSEGIAADALADAADKGGEGLWAGSQLAIAAGFQTLGNARVAWVGGVELFSDEFAKKEISKGVKSGNQQTAADIAAWAFQESLVLRIDSTTHHLVNSSVPKEYYTINDVVEYVAQISRFNPIKDKWEPYSGINDLQLEFTMLDPHVRTVLPPVPGSPGKYAVTFRVPDRHGVFKFVINHKRKGWTYLQSSTTVPVVPPRHDGYPRFLSAAWPYYAGAISTSIGFFLFSAIYLAGDAREANLRKAKGAKAQ